eukprot:3975405-Alexandrium_andersonii.AAC.1
MARGRIDCHFVRCGHWLPPDKGGARVRIWTLGAPWELSFDHERRKAEGTMHCANACCSGQTRGRVKHA